MERIDTVIVGAGQAGLATSYYLNRYQREHVVLEQAPYPASVWRDQRWDSFTLVTPNWATKLPGAEYDGPAPDGFMPRDEVIACFNNYVERFQLPVECNTRVLAVEPLAGNGSGPRYRVRTPDREYAAANVVMATGFFQEPKLPPFAAALSPDITQLHSSTYRNPAALPPGAVLVVGSAQSGCQIAEELHQAGRPVFLATGRAGRAPRRYRGRDVIEWLDLIGFFDLTPEQLPPGMSKFTGIPHVSGTRGGHTINLHQFARDGMTLLGHVRGVDDATVALAPDLHDNLASADGFERQMMQRIDGYIAMNGLDAPPEDLPQLRDGFEQPVIEHLDLAAAGISTVIWALGYTFDYGLVKLPVRDGDGCPVQTRGVTDYPGLYFVGQPWMPSQRSGFLVGMRDSAAHIASTIVDTGRTPRVPTVAAASPAAR